MKIIFFLRLIMLLAGLCFITGCSAAPSFDCATALSTLDEAICADETLSRLDGQMAEQYFKLQETLDGRDRKQLLEEQRRWLQGRVKTCLDLNARCLAELYRERILALRSRRENLVPFTSVDPGGMQGTSVSCSFGQDKFPDNLLVYAGGASKGKKIEYQIDDSGHQATQFDVVVNSPERPVALILGGYEPSIWNLGWTRGTEIEAVVVTGYHRQAVAGLPRDTPILNSSHHNRGPCGSLTIRQKTLRRVNPLSRRVFSRDVDMVYLARNGRLMIGEPVVPGDELYTSKDTLPDAFYSLGKPRAGKAGLQDLVDKGVLRKATKADFERWAKNRAELHREEVPPIANGSATEVFKMRYTRNAYVILGKMTFPAGLYGAHRATFFLEKGVPYPDGNPGHSAIHDFNTMECGDTSCN